MKIDRIYKTLPNGILIPDVCINTCSNYEFTVAVNNNNLRYCTGIITESFQSAHIEHHFSCVANPHNNFIICYRPVTDWIVLSDDITEI